MRLPPPAHDVERRQTLNTILTAGLDAADPTAAVGRVLATENDWVAVDGTRYEVDGRVIVLGLGKAAGSMARAALELLAEFDLAGAVVAPEPFDDPRLEGHVGGHPTPTAGSVAGGRALLGLASSSTPDDLVVVLLSGGGSSLAEVPADGLSMDDIVATTEALLSSGVPIEDANTVRRHLSQLKGGRLAAASAAPVVTIAISDVPEAHPEALSSGPTLPDPTSPADALTIIDRLEVPASVRRHLASAAAPPATQPHQFVVAASGRSAAEASAREARRRGLSTRVDGLSGEARSVGASLVAQLDRGCTVLHGETTVTVRGHGTGGRNQEVALAAGIAAAGRPDVAVATLGTDGVDGPTPAAGAYGDGGTVERGRALGLDAHRALADNDAYPYLKTTGDLIVTGPTGTNVADLVVAIRN